MHWSWTAWHDFTSEWLERASCKMTVNYTKITQQNCSKLYNLNTIRNKIWFSFIVSEFYVEIVSFEFVFLQSLFCALRWARTTFSRPRRKLVLLLRGKQIATIITRAINWLNDCVVWILYELKFEKIDT